jgi:ABC-2 type transport system ATP-binding protein
LIQVQNLVKRYGGNTAVDNVSFTIEKGQVYGFLGPNGAGKSTTMNILTGYIGPTSGQVTVNGHDILDEPRRPAAVSGICPSSRLSIWIWWSPSTLCFCAELKKVPKKERESQIRQIMDAVGLEQVSGRLIRNLSKGYRQRVGLAQALVGYPEIIILDEPTVGLDPKQIIEVRQLIRSLSKEHTVIFSSHILSEVQEVCDRCSSSTKASWLPPAPPRIWSAA